MINRSPGYKPNEVWWKDQILQIIGAPVLLKRLQMPDIFRALAIQPGMNVLDFGCGSGYMTYQMAYLGANAFGIDIIKMDNYFIPENLREKLTFIRYSGERTPFKEKFFDVILLSEVITTIPEPQKFIAEIQRIIKTNDRLIIVQPLDRRGIREDYENNSAFIRFMRMIRPIPVDYNDYITRIQTIFGNAIHSLPPEEYYYKLLNEYGFQIDKKNFSPSGPVIKLYERIQFFSLCFGLPTYGVHYFILFPIFKILDAWYHDQYGTWCIFITSLKKGGSNQSS